MIKDRLSLIFWAVLLSVGILWWQRPWEGENPGPPAPRAPLYSRAADLASDMRQKPYVDQLVAAVNKVSSQDPLCIENLNPISVGVNSARTEFYQKATFQVLCWSDQNNKTITYFGLDGFTIAPYMSNRFK